MLTRLKIQTRLHAGFAMVVAAGMILAIYGTFQLTGIGDQVTRLGIIATNLTRVDEASQHLQAGRASEIQMRLDGDQAAFEDAKIQIDKARELLNTAARTTLSDERRSMYTSLQGSLETHAGALVRFAAVEQVQADERAKLFAGGALLTAASTKLSVEAGRSHHELAGNINTAILLARIAYWRFVATSDPKDLVTFEDKAARAQGAVLALGAVASPAEKALLEPTRAALDSYQAAFGGFSTARLKSIALYQHALQPQIAGMQAAFVAARAAQATAFTTGEELTQHTAAHARTMQEIVAGLSLLLSTSIAAVIARSIVHPITMITAVMTRLAGGNTSDAIPARDSRDEIGEMARAVEVFRQQGIENTRMAQEADREQASRNRRQAAMDTHTQDFGRSIAGVMSSLSNAADAIRESSAVMNQGAQQTQVTTSGTFEGAQASTRDLTTVAVAAEQLASSVHEISRQVSNVTASVRTAVARALETDQKVAALSQAADRIVAVVSLITQVARQTNLLALNATIEAARAGEAGRGFAVVANEVKALAAQTARATDEIAGQIVAIRSATSDAVHAVRDVGHAISQVEEVATAIALAVEQQAVATQDITANMQRVTKTTTAATSAMGEVLAIAETTGKSSAVVLDAAEDVGRTSNTLRQEVTDFLAAMSAGDEKEARKYERIVASGAFASIRFTGGRTVKVALSDISLGGAALVYTGQEPEGTDMEITLPGNVEVHARIARISYGSIAILFRQDAATLGLVNRALEVVRGNILKAAA